MSAAGNVRCWAVAAGLALAAAWPCPAEDVPVPGAVFDLEFAGRVPDSLRTVAREWITTAAKNVATIYGRFPVAKARVRVVTHPGHEPGNGEASGEGGPHLTVEMGRETRRADVADDWVLTHEMLHLCFPSLPRQQHWLEEGIATYIEPVARTRAGLHTAEQLWAEFVEGMPNGLPERGDRGLDHTPTWGRTYWGGAIFCLRADVEIRKRTNNRFGFAHVLRAIADAGGRIDVDWKIEKVIAVGDGATGVPVLRELYDAMKDQPAPTDLEALWKQLGVEHHGQKVILHNDAPLAKIRQAIESGSTKERRPGG